MATGRGMLDLAVTRLDEPYVNVRVPKDDANWHGPWDCAEFMSWLVYQVSGRLYGCTDNGDHPSRAEAYTGSWKADSRNGAIGTRVGWKEAAATVGAIMLRFPPQPGVMGHIAVSDGEGGTVEARGRAYGVTRHVASGRDWDTGVLIPWIAYDPPSANLALAGPRRLYAAGRKNLRPEVIAKIQLALQALGADPGPIDGIFGPLTTTAVAAFQAVAGLVVDGKVGAETASALGISLTP